MMLRDHSERAVQTTAAHESMRRERLSWPSEKQSLPHDYSAVSSSTYRFPTLIDLLGIYCVHI
jgi:hypothetical protein